MKRPARVIASSVAVVILVLAIVGSVALSGNKAVRQKGLWSDATDVLSGQAAGQAGREARKPFIDTEQGNMLVFFFALSGVAAGFIIGYNSRRLLGAKSRDGDRAMPKMFVSGVAGVAVCLALAGVHAFSRPLVDPALGDVALFASAVFGAASGFIAGYGLRGCRRTAAGAIEFRRRQLQP
ncbi:MAG: hypothetical protein HY530_08275 [Chloroflexi bacterium]|nr:hypothetical protein [Chloroflexota bacterium]